MECLEMPLRMLLCSHCSPNPVLASGAHPLFLPTFDLDVEALCTLGGPGGSATVEVLPAGALRPLRHDLWIQE